MVKIKDAREPAIDIAWIFGKWGSTSPHALQWFDLYTTKKDSVIAFANEELFSNGGAQDIVYVVFDTGGDTCETLVLRDE